MNECHKMNYYATLRTHTKQTPEINKERNKVSPTDFQTFSNKNEMYSTGQRSATCARIVLVWKVWN